MNQDLRFEVKIPIPVNRYSEVSAWLANHPMLFQQHHPERWVNSLYLDTDDMACFEENLSGISQRKKVRIRWYHDLECRGGATLEFKHRRSGKGYKNTYDTSLDFNKSLFNWNRALTQCYRALPDKNKILWCKESRPILICRYLRSYYQSRCEKVRATFDDHIHMYDQRYSPKINLDRAVSLGEYRLLELKVNHTHENELNQLLSTCPLRISRHSKYVNGVRQLMWT